MFDANLATLITFGLISAVGLNVLVVMAIARWSERTITDEVMKANKRLQDQINSRVG